MKGLWNTHVSIKEEMRPYVNYAPYDVTHMCPGNVIYYAPYDVTHMCPRNVI